MIAGVETENVFCDPDHAPFRAGLSSVSYRMSQWYDLPVCKIWYNSSFSRSRDMLVPTKI